MIEIPYKYSNIKKYNKGLTNDNYLLDIDHTRYMLRYPKNDTMHLFNRDQEKQILKHLENKSFTFPLFYYDNGVQLIKYYDDLVNFEDYTQNDKIEKVSQLMKLLHQEQVDPSLAFNPLDQIYKYYANIENKPFNLDEYQELFDTYNKHSFTPVLCHNDWVEGNICYLNESVYLIDFEYAGMNDPLFDIMSFVTENNLSNEEISEFVNLMFDEKVNEEKLKTLAMYRDINNLLWALWALMMYEFRNEEIYNQIYKDKRKALDNSYKSKFII